LKATVTANLIKYTLCHVGKLWIVKYLKEIYINILLNEDLDVLDKQLYYIRFCNKVYEECLKTLHLECLNHIRCLVCEEKQEINYVARTRWIFYMFISQEIYI
jgi:hypothetical protein